MKQSNYQRIKKVINYYYLKGVNKEKINDIYRKIINQKLKK